MWSYILTLLIGAAIPVFIRWIDSKERQKFFNLEVKEKMKLVAIEKRLEAHQQAFKIWLDLHSLMNKHTPDDMIKTVNNAYDFWNNNALYLEVKTRKDFTKAIEIVTYHQNMIEKVRQAEDRKEKEKYKAMLYEGEDFFQKLFETIQKEVELEPIKPPEINIDYDKKD